MIAILVLLSLSLAVAFVATVFVGLVREKEAELIAEEKQRREMEEEREMRDKAAAFERWRGLERQVDKRRNSNLDKYKGEKLTMCR